MQGVNKNRITVKTVLSGSFKKNPEGLKACYAALQASGCQVLSPSSANITKFSGDFAWVEGDTETDPIEVEKRHIAAIKNSNFVWLYAPDGYVGLSGALEIGMAHVYGKPIFTTDTIQDPIIRAMVTQVTAIKFGVYTGIIVRDHTGRFLTLHFPQKMERQWRFAGGKVEPGELLIIAAARELEEELGVEGINLRLVNTQTEYVDGGIWTGFFFEADVMGMPVIMEPHKHDDLQWLTSLELKERDAHPEWEVAAALEAR